MYYDHSYAFPMIIVHLSFPTGLIVDVVQVRGSVQQPELGLQCTSMQELLCDWKYGHVPSKCLVDCKKNQPMIFRVNQKASPCHQHSVNLGSVGMFSVYSEDTVYLVPQTWGWRGSKKRLGMS